MNARALLRNEISTHTRIPPPTCYSAILLSILPNANHKLVVFIHFYWDLDANLYSHNVRYILPSISLTFSNIRFIAFDSFSLNFTPNLIELFFVL